MLGFISFFLFFLFFIFFLLVGGFKELVLEAINMEEKDFL